MNYKKIFLKHGKDESLKRFHPWIFSGAITRMDNGITEGEIVRVLTSEGDFIAIGHYQIGSIAVRVLSFRDVKIDAAFWQDRLLAAFQMRILSVLPTPFMKMILIDWCTAKEIVSQDLSLTVMAAQP